MYRFPVMVAFALVSLAGCRPSRSDLVEAELRTRNRELREMHCDLMRAETMNEALESTLRAQQTSTPPGIARCVTPSIKDIQLARGTGGVNEDGCDGDEGLLVVLVPRDIDGSPVKVAGIVKIAAIEITPEGLKVPLSTWDITALQLRRSWKTGLLSSGYHIPLAWQKLPSFSKLRIVATFSPLEGGVYEADKDVTIQPQRAMQPIMPPAGLAPPIPGESGPILPLPPAIPPALNGNHPAAKLGPPRSG